MPPLPHPEPVYVPAEQLRPGLRAALFSTWLTVAEPPVLEHVDDTGRAHYRIVLAGPFGEEAVHHVPAGTFYRVFGCGLALTP